MLEGLVSIETKGGNGADSNLRFADEPDVDTQGGGLVQEDACFVGVQRSMVLH